jgi:drug/metabolite transporter (DMT)-like permease
VTGSPYFLLAVLLALAGAVLAIGLPLRRRFRRRRQYVAGVIAVAVGLVSLWVLPAIVIINVPGMAHGSELELPLLILALFIGGGILGGGANAISKANNTPRDDYYDTLFGE